MKYTPGPWAASIGGFDQDIHIYCRESGNLIAGIIPATVGKRSTISRQPNSKIDEANAHLIAAAPEMLEVLHECHELLWNSEFGHKNKAANKLREKILTTISKAEGK